jgi:hypothetical protein
MKRHVPPHLKKKFRRERWKLVGMSTGVFLCILLGLSAVARKHYNKALPWHTAWLAHFGNGGWRVALKSAIPEGATYEEIEARLGTPSFSEFSVAIGKTVMVYNRPGSDLVGGEGRNGSGLTLYVDRENPVPLGVGTPVPSAMVPPASEQGQ